MKNVPPQRRAPGPDDLRHGAVKIVPANAIHALQVPEQPGSGWRRMRRRDADNRPPGHDEHHGEIRKRGDGALRDPLNALTCGTSGCGRDRRRSRSNPLVHG
jgi:hypothetical protein